MQYKRHKLNLVGKRVECFLIKDLKSILQSTKRPLNHNYKSSVYEIEQFVCGLRIFPIR